MNDWAQLRIEERDLLVAKTLGVAKSTVEIRRGLSWRDKTVFIRKLSAAELAARLIFSLSP